MKTYIKHKNIYNGMVCVILMAIMVLALQTTVYAATATVSISSSNVTQGDEFDVVITIKADTNIGAYNFYIDYDADIVEAVSGFNGGGNGRIQLMYYVPNTDVKKELTAKIRFKAKKAGTTSIKYVSISDDNGVIDFDTADNMSVTATEGSVTVKAPYVASTNNYLSDLKVEAVKADGTTYSLDLSPAFSKEVTKYSAEAAEGVTKLVITASKEDSKASIKTSGTKMDPGDNTTSITVTAEDGSTRKYVIYTTVAKPPESVTPPPEPITVKIDGTDSYIEDINDAVVLPEGFETFEYQYKGKTVVAAKGLVKNLIVMYVTKGDGSAGQLYIYEADTDTFYPMSNLQMTQKLYTIVKEPDNLVIPAGFTETTVSVGEQSFKGWVNSEVENIYLIYAMNWNGDSGLYYYDVNEGQIMRYFDIAAQAGVAVDDYNSILSANEKLKDEINQLKADNNNDEAGSVTLYKYLAYGSCIMAIIYLGIIIYLVAGRRGDDEEDDETKDIEINESEIKAIPEALISEEEASGEEGMEADNLIEESTEELNLSEESLEKAAMSEESSEEKALGEEDSEDYAPLESFVGFNDEQDEIDDMLMDLEDIITSETEAAIAKENGAVEKQSEENKSLVGNNEFAEEIVPDIEQSEATADKVKEAAIEAEAKEGTSVEETRIEEPEKEEAVINEAEPEEITEKEATIKETEPEEETEKEAVIKETEEVAETAIKEATTTTIEEPNKEEAITEEAIIEKSVSEETIPEEALKDKKKRVEQIMKDEESSISADDLDMVIDELFDDLFG